MSKMWLRSIRLRNMPLKNARSRQVELGWYITKVDSTLGKMFLFSRVFAKKTILSQICAVANSRMSTEIIFWMWTPSIFAPRCSQQRAHFPSQLLKEYLSQKFAKISNTFWKRNAFKLKTVSIWANAFNEISFFRTITHKLINLYNLHIWYGIKANKFHKTKHFKHKSLPVSWKLQ